MQLNLSKLQRNSKQISKNQWKQRSCQSFETPLLVKFPNSSTVKCHQNYRHQSASQCSSTSHPLPGSKLNDNRVVLSPRRPVTLARNITRWHPQWIGRRSTNCSASKPWIQRAPKICTSTSHQTWLEDNHLATCNLTLSTSMLPITRQNLISRIKELKIM